MVHLIYLGAASQLLHLNTRPWHCRPWELISHTDDHLGGTHALGRAGVGCIVLSHGATQCPSAVLGCRSTRPPPRSNGVIHPCYPHMGICCSPPPSPSEGCLAPEGNGDALFPWQWLCSFAEKDGRCAAGVVQKHGAGRRQLWPRTCCFPLAPA